MQIYIEIHLKLYDLWSGQKFDLDLGPTRANVSNGTSTHDGEQLCQIILKSIHTCRTYSLDKFGWTDTHTQKHAHTRAHQ